MRYFPTFFDIRDQPVLVVGGGLLALRKVRLLAKARPQLIIWAPSFIEKLKSEFPAAVFVQRDFAPEKMPINARLLVVATEDDAVNKRATAWAQAHRIPVNVVDRPELCDFVIPSMVERGDLVVGISTGGAAPIVGRNLRAQIETLLPKRLGSLVEFAKNKRAQVAAHIAENKRRSFWETFFKSPAAAAVLSGDEAEAEHLATALIEASATQGAELETGMVSIVGAGPGDPELLTLKALRVLQEADVVLHDNLVSDPILELVRRDADRVYVGKKKANHSLPQNDISTLMVSLARSGKKVVRLKGGDPFIFGRGGEELDVLQAEGIPAEVVPGITAATGCGAATGIPLTHRDHAQAVTFVTGHAKANTEPDLNWQALAQLGHTLVVYMGVGKAGSISAKLIAAGQSHAVPVAIIENGTTDKQLIVKTTLQRLPQDIVRAGIVGPALLVIGEVAAKADGKGLLDLVASERSAA